MDWQREQEKLQEQTRRAIRDSLYELELILEDKGEEIGRNCMNRSSSVEKTRQ